MGSNEAVITNPGALEKLTFFTGTGRHRAQIIYFFRMQIGSRTPSGIGLGSGSRPRGMRVRLGLPRELWIEIFGKSWPIEFRAKDHGRCILLWQRRRRRRRRLHATSSRP